RQARRPATGLCYPRRVTGVARAEPTIPDERAARRARGIFYTPAELVDYVVRHTVGPLLDGKRPEEIARLTIVDPACGAGAFLVGAHRLLCAWYRDRWRAEGARGRLERGPGGSLRLVAAERARIARDHLVGLDTDG